MLWDQNSGTAYTKMRPDHLVWEIEEDIEPRDTFIDPGMNRGCLWERKLGLFAVAHMLSVESGPKVLIFLTSGGRTIPTVFSMCDLLP